MPLPMLIFAVNPVTCDTPVSRPLETCQEANANVEKPAAKREKNLLVWYALGWAYSLLTFASSLLGGGEPQGACTWVKHRRYATGQRPQE